MNRRFPWLRTSIFAAGLFAISCPSSGIAQPPASPPSLAPDAHAAAAPSGPLWYDRFHGHIGGVVGFHGWGGMTLSGSGFSGGPDVAGQLLGGFMLAGYVPVSPDLHVGGYLMYGSGKLKLSGSAKSDGYPYDLSGTKMDADHLSAGFSLKVGRRVHERIWLGLVGDLGFYSLSAEGTDDWYGVMISPRLHVDVLGLNTGRTKLGPFASFGPTAVPYAAGNIADGIDGRAWFVYITLFLGVTFGS